MLEYRKAFKHIDRFLKLQLKEKNIPGMAVAITDREKTLKVFTYGYADIAARTAITLDTLFEVASIGKSFTSIALLQLQEEGKLWLNKPVKEYLPWFQVKSKFPPITVQHLMGHTAGIVRGSELAPHGLYDSWALQETEVRVPPGQFWHYSSIGYKTLGFLLEKVTGQSLREVLQTRILNPLGMTATKSTITFETRKKTSIGYTSLYDDRPEHPSHQLVPAMWSEYATGDGCLASNLGDMAIYLRMLINRGVGQRGRILSEKSFNLMAPIATKASGELYGYAIVSYPVEDHVYLGHGGGNTGFSSHILSIVDEDIGVVILTNRRTEFDTVYESAAYILEIMRAVRLRKGLPPLPLATPIHIVNAPDYAGTFRWGDKTLEFAASGSNLLLKHQSTSIALEGRYQDNFYARHPEFDLFFFEFKRDKGKVREVFHGPDWFINKHYTGSQNYNYPEEWKSYVGHYRARNPELSNFRVVIRKGALILIFPSGYSEPLIPLGDSLFQIGTDYRSPEAVRFSAVVDGHACRADYSGCPYYRTFTP